MASHYIHWQQNIETNHEQNRCLSVQKMIKGMIMNFISFSSSLITHRDQWQAQNNLEYHNRRGDQGGHTTYSQDNYLLLLWIVLYTFYLMFFQSFSSTRGENAFLQFKHSCFIGTLPNLMFF